jgi:hypothetical protein
MRFSMGAVARFGGTRRIRSCGYKQKHWTLQAAMRHYDAIRRRFGPRADRLNVYRCLGCGAYHIGRPKPRGEGR